MKWIIILYINEIDMRTIILTEEQLKYYTEAKDVTNKPDYIVLWLDDQRNPENYFKKKTVSNAFLKNLDFYKRLGEDKNIKFIWVKTPEEFQKYISKNGLPDMVSFDFDLGAGVPKGSECAEWFKKYCTEIGKSCSYYIHSANNRAQSIIPGVLGIGQQLNELVYVNGLKGKKANLTYSTNPKNKDNKILKTDTLSTDKMDKDDDSTNLVPLKGGLMSYNITGINGTHVMHYFKKYFQNEKEKIKDNKGKEYELEMLSNEFNAFMERFKEKVWTVVESCIEGFQREDKEFQPVGISLYPVPSSSNFNVKMAEFLNGGNINGLHIHVIPQNLFVKDLRNLSLDNDFIEKNKDFYNGDKYQTPTNGVTGTYLQHTENDVKRQKLISDMEKWINMANDFSTSLLSGLNNYYTYLKNGRNTDGIVKGMVRNYKLFCDVKRAIVRDAKYVDSISGSMQRVNSTSIYQYIKGYKPASVESRSEAIWKIVKPRLRGSVSDIDGNPYSKEDIVPFQKIPFEIKKLSDGERMGIKNIYNPNKDDEFVKNEVKKTRNTVFVIFDDNISGGSTLSDVCLQAKNLGIDHIVPITFGKMSKGNGGGGLVINTPVDKSGNKGFNY